MLDAIILAAGMGKRLENSENNLPKCLLEFNGITLLERHLENLLKLDIGQIHVVTGYQSDKLLTVISESKARNITRHVVNPAYDKGSHISLLYGLNSLNTDKDFILMDADVLYDFNILARLFTTSHINCFLLDRDFIPGEEPVKLCVKNDVLIEFRKQIDPGLQFDIQGESVGFFRFSGEIADKLRNGTELYLNQGKDDIPYEEVIRDLLLHSPDEFGYEDITGLAWIEIDYPEDIKRARTEILPLIEMRIEN